MQRRQVQEGFGMIGFNVAIAPLPPKTVQRSSWDVLKQKWERWEELRRDSKQCTVDFIPETKTFEIKVNKGVTLDLLDIQPLDRHLVLSAKDKNHKLPSKFLCGHDERSGFVAAIPERRRVDDVIDAKDALQPPRIKAVVERAGLPKHRRHTRKNKAFVRQGEWFFVPVPESRVPDTKIHKNEPIRRGRARPHMCAELRRTKGREVMFHDRLAPNGIALGQYGKLSFMKRRTPGWKRMRADATVFVRGDITHPDHRTVHLNKWHEVIMNTETKSRAMRQVRFLD